MSAPPPKFALPLRTSFIKQKTCPSPDRATACLVAGRRWDGPISMRMRLLGTTAPPTAPCGKVEFLAAGVAPERGDSPAGPLHDATGLTRRYCRNSGIGRRLRAQRMRYQRHIRRERTMRALRNTQRPDSHATLRGETRPAPLGRWKLALLCSFSRITRCEPLEGDDPGAGGSGSRPESAGLPTLGCRIWTWMGTLARNIESRKGACAACAAASMNAARQTLAQVCSQAEGSQWRPTTILELVRLEARGSTSWSAVGQIDRDLVSLNVC